MHFTRLASMAAAVTMFVAAPPSVAQPDFASWLRDLRAEAVRKGISQATLDTALSQIKPIPRVIELDRKQPEFTLTFAQYQIGRAHV